MNIFNFILNNLTNFGKSATFPQLALSWVDHVLNARFEGSF